MRIVIDMQGAQAENRFRGIGRYTLALAKEITLNCKENEVILALNGRFEDSITSIREAFYGLLPQENIRVWYPCGTVNHINAANDRFRRISELIYEAFLFSLNPSIILISSLFEGLVDDAITSVRRFNQSIPIATILYDLIPFIYRKPYLENAVVERWYENKLMHLRRTDLQLAISESSRQESIEHLGTPGEQVVNISTAADSQFLPMCIKPKKEAGLRQRYGIHKPYVLYTGGIDHRKNIDGLIRAYARLAAPIRKSHQLAVVCSIQPAERKRLHLLTSQQGLTAEEVVFTGYVPEEDLLALYNLCKAFVFPSWHEGFGLPALEAMSCGRAVIASNRSSLPEVISRKDALFDPFDDEAIANKLHQVLVDKGFRHSLEQHGIKQAKRFSWDKSAKLAIEALERCVASHATDRTVRALPRHRPRLAYVSPLPPERSGISDYSAELLPELARFYDIDVILAQEVVSPPWIKANCPQRSIQWFFANATQFDRVLYHFGNSSFHQHMFALLREIPGVVVLHDFYLSGIIAHMDYHGLSPGMWSQSLYSSHGYAALQHRFIEPDLAKVVWRYPCNHAVLQDAQGVIIHSENSRRLAQQWYGENTGSDWAHIPLLRIAVKTTVAKRNTARRVLGLGQDQYIVCSFGMMGPSKLNHRVLDAWLSSPLAEDDQCILIFVGENDAGEYGTTLRDKIARSDDSKERIRITGWTDASLFRQYLHAADVGVQLRTLSRGETSAAVLDCMNYGLATIVNANGSMADLPANAVWKLPDEFTDEQLAQALVTLRENSDQRYTLGISAQEMIQTCHAPRACATSYYAAIENFHNLSSAGLTALVRAIATLDGPHLSDEHLRRAAEAIDRSIVPRSAQAQLFVDISELVQRDARSGIQRVVRSILQEWLRTPPRGYRIEPVYATPDNPGYRYARQFTLDFLDCPSDLLDDDPICYHAGDVFLGLDFQPLVVPAQQNFYQTMRRAGVTVKFIVYDLLLLLLPHCFINGGSQLLQTWLKVVAQSDGAICISESVANDLQTWLEQNAKARQLPFDVDWFHLGADISGSVPTQGVPDNAAQVLRHMQEYHTFLMVGTIEPRKGYAQVLTAFEQLWMNGHQFNLAIVGKQGWMVESLVEQLRTHPENGKRLFWLEGISDEYLEKLYAVSACLIAASFGEGFGLPLIEAAKRKLPIIARDIPVFREVAGEHAYYFNDTPQENLSQAILNWLKLYKTSDHPKSCSMPWFTWKESASRLASLCLPRNLS
ncbi:glycosyl transferase group 1 [Desulfobulbus propionicus DSM 2032]|uniref:Glycosyl transferase group 1 n=1 Tax=Desulfobulbus propionicus (strain ATCC 33891 / DSM 2032 / VKM B-1956 / 1pr3) TaxID=577650 RepID=A0A7U4DN57_DESPD|nr:glycosyltransferase [Desulfobulbus propionicus]ADW16717.1 glycosyl transferase group 1 [Desulfobulbus propionicus DSM 2032]